MRQFVRDRYRPLYDAIEAYRAGLITEPGIWELADLYERVHNAANVQVVMQMAQELENMESHILEMGERE